MNRNTEPGPGRPAQALGALVRWEAMLEKRSRETAGEIRDRLQPRPESSELCYPVECPPVTEVTIGRMEPLPIQEAAMAIVHDGIADATREFYLEAERKAAQLPEAPDGWRWVLVHEPIDWHTGNRVSYSIEGRFELVENTDG